MLHIKFFLNDGNLIMFLYRIFDWKIEIVKITFEKKPRLCPSLKDRSCDLYQGLILRKGCSDHMTYMSFIECVSKYKKG